MVTVASEVTVPSALRLMLMSPLLMVSSTTDIGAALRPAPPRPCGSGAGFCLVHQTTPAINNSTMIVVITEPLRDRGLAGEDSTRSLSVGGCLSGLSMNLRHIEEIELL